MATMAESLANSPSTLAISNGFSCNRCSNIIESRTKFYVCMSSGYYKLHKQTKFHEINGRNVAVLHGQSDMFDGYKRYGKVLNLKGNVGYGLSCEQGKGQLSEGHEEDEQHFYGDCDGGSLDEISMVSKGGEKKMFYLEERDEEVLLNEGYEKEEEDVQEDLKVDGGGDCGDGSLDQILTLSKEGEAKMFYLEERDEEALSKRLLGLSRTNRRKSALALFRSMEFAGLRPDLHSCNSLLACLARNDMVDDMVRVFEFIKRNEIISGHSCSLVLKALAKNRGSDTALRVFLVWDVEGEMKKHFDSVVYNTMISICGKENKWVQMESVWKSMKENRVIGTTVTYRVLVCTFVRCGQYEIAIDAYSEMLQSGLQPGDDAMQAVIGACSKEEKWNMALSVFHNMLKCGFKPNLAACNALINSLGKAGKVREAFKVYKHIGSLGHTPDSYTWNALLAAFYRAKQYATALQLFDSIQKDLGFQPNMHLYNTALMCCQRLRLWDKALQLLWKMENSGISISTESYNIVISACEVARKPKVALEVFEHMSHRRCYPDTFTRLSLVRSCIWADLWDEVENILDDSAPNVSLYNAAIHGMFLKGKIDSAKTLYMKMRDIGLVPDGKTRALMLQYMQRY